MSIDELVLHPTLYRHVRAYSTDPPHAILLYGKKSSGKATLAQAIAEDIISTRKGSSIVEIAPLEERKIISIDQIRQLKIMLRTKSSAYRIILIPDADILTLEAQNTFLKLLEEPPVGVVFLLTSSKPESLLPTIRSRLLKLRYISPTKEQQIEYANKSSTENFDTALRIAEGRIPVLKALVDAGDSNPTLEYIELAKDILSEQKEERLIRVDAMSKDNAQTEAVIEALLVTSMAALRHSLENKRDYSSWLKRVRAVEQAQNQLNRNVLTKLVLCRLFLVL